jgi:hypothetical protein
LTAHPIPAQTMTRRAQRLIIGPPNQI